MAKGDIVYPTTANQVMSKIKEMRSKWGISTSGSVTFSTGNKTLASERNNLTAWIQEGKNKSGWGGTVPSGVSVGQLLTDEFSALLNAAEAIRTHCPCNCNYCSCNCDRCSCNCNRCCTDGSDNSRCVDWTKREISW